LRGMAELRSKYPVSETFKILDGLDLYRTGRTIVALVVVKSDYGKDLRLYRWQNRLDKKTNTKVWKVDLARFSVSKWNWEEIAEKVQQLKAKHNIP